MRVLSSLIYSQNGNWLYDNPQENKVHDITIDDINQLLLYAEQDDAWADAVKQEVIDRDRAIKNGTYTKKTDWLIEEFSIMQTSGSVVCMPYGLRIITFPSKRQLFRGESRRYENTVPSLNRILKNVSTEKEKEIIRVIAYMRKWQFANLIWKINVVPYWEAKLSDINYDALAQHYGLATHLLDLTNDFRAALFFAACKYEASTDSYRPLTQSDIDESEDTKYGYIFHAPDWAVDYFNGGGHTNWSHKHLYKQESTEYIPIKKDRLYLQSGDMDGVALQIGYQPLQRCHHQSGYIYPMRNIASLQDDWHFEKLRFRQSVALSERVYEMMDHGKKVFPYEGVTELREQIDQIKHSTVFSEFELQSAYDYDGVDKRLFPSIEELRKSITGYNAYDGKICIQSDPVDYKIPQEILDKVNSHYDGKDLLEAVGGMLHVKYPDCEYRKQRCIEIYGREI